MMNKNNTPNGIWSVIILIAIQLLADNYVNLGVYVSIFICGYIILSLPFKLKTIPTMFIAFALGLGLDILGNGIMGINAGALTAMALSREFFLRITTTEQSMEIISFPSSRDLGLSRYAVYVLLSYLVFFIFYIPLDAGFHAPLLFSILKIVISSIVNTTLIIIISVLTIK